MAILQKLFGFAPAKHNVKTEMLAGLTSFLTMAYILAVNPNIFSALSEQGMDTQAVFTATVIASVIGTLVMSFYAKMPFGLAPGMGLNAFFVYTVCLKMGYSWHFALTAILIEGIIFIIMSVTSLREKLVNAIPSQIKASISVGIGLFIASLGLKNSGIIVENPATLVTLGDIKSGTQCHLSQVAETERDTGHLGGALPLEVYLRIINQYIIYNISIQV